MNSSANGTNTARVMTSCVIFSCARLMPPAKPMRLAGTISRYSNRAMPQLASAATSQTRCSWYLRWPYQAKVMKTLEAVSSATMRTGAGIDSIIDRV